MASKSLPKSVPKTVTKPLPKPKKAAGEKRDVWSERETDALVDHFIIKKDIITGAYSPTVTKESKKAAWEEIAAVIRLECPDSKVKSVEEVKKKWNNLKTAALKDIAAHRASLTGTGGGPVFLLKPVYEKMYTYIFHKDNPSLTGAKINGSVDTEMEDPALEEIMRGLQGSGELTLEIVNDDSISQPATPLLSQSDDSQEYFDSAVSIPASIRFAVNTPSSTSKTPSPVTVTTPPSSTAGGQTDRGKRLASNESSQPLTVRQTVKKAKVTVCESTTMAANFRVQEQRLKVLKLAMDVRRELGIPFDVSEIPEDLHKLLFNTQKEL